MLESIWLPGRETYRWKCFQSCSIDQSDMSSRVFVAMVVLMAFSMGGSAQTILVADKADLHPIEGVTFLGATQEASAITDASGHADLRALRGAPQIIIQHVAFEIVVLPYDSLVALKGPLLLSARHIRWRSSLLPQVVSRNASVTFRSRSPF